MNGDGIELAVNDAGDGPAVLLLHGFPDTAALWRHQIPALHAAGLRTIAPDLRGFGASDKPQEIERVPRRRTASPIWSRSSTRWRSSKVRVVGHDWGAGVAWAMALMAPDRVERLAVLSVGHPASFSRRPVAQREKSWYMLLFQFAEAEDLLRKDDWALLREWMASHPERDAAIERLGATGRADRGAQLVPREHAPAQRAARRRVPERRRSPTLGLWSSGDALPARGRR